uniref:SFRICE_022721 n=1 Tax=Spodoptera frugiperda TaxID=7108 RepID=A0A2H1W770_SPOFR
MKMKRQKCVRTVAIGVPLSLPTPIGDRREVIYASYVAYLRPHLHRSCALARFRWSITEVLGRNQLAKCGSWETQVFPGMCRNRRRTMGGAGAGLLRGPGVAHRCRSWPLGTLSGLGIEPFGILAQLSITLAYYVVLQALATTKTYLFVDGLVRRTHFRASRLQRKALHYCIYNKNILFEQVGSRYDVKE